MGLRRQIKKYWGTSRNPRPSQGIRDHLCDGAGLEIGALSMPYPFRHASVKYADIGTAEELRARLDEIPIENLYPGELVEPDFILQPPDYSLSEIPDDQFNFVYSSHALEHSPNPIMSLSEQLRVVKSGGTVYAVIPNKFNTHDKLRRTTQASELVDRYRNKEFNYTLSQAKDVILGTEGHPLYDKYKQQWESYARRILSRNEGIHHFFTFDPDSTASMLNFVTREMAASLLYFNASSIDIHFALRKA